MMVTGPALRRFCDECSKKYGLKIDVSFLDKYKDQDYWYLEDMKNQKKAALLRFAMGNYRVKEGEDFSVDAMTGLRDYMLTDWKQENESKEEF